jgi:hypothetical protein
MEYPVPQLINEDPVVSVETLIQEESSTKSFIEANTEPISLEDLRRGHIIPVFVKDNEPLISQADFIESTMEVVSDLYQGETILKPSVRISHPIKGRIPTAKNKPAKELYEHEKTLYYERIMFAIEVASIRDTIDGNTLSLTIGGVKGYNLDNLYNKKGSDQHFKIFIGFKNSVCTNLCVWSDGYMGDIRVQHIGQLKSYIRCLIEGYNQNFHLYHLKKLQEYSITEQQFAHLIGRCRMYNHLPSQMKREINPLLLNDTQIGAVVKDYFRDNSFCRGDDGNINLWRLYNLFTSSNKSSYIDSFLDRSKNSYDFVEQIRYCLEKQTSNWYLN